jgi:glycosyltransferase involved in cell wall biosynthesis
MNTLRVALDARRLQDRPLGGVGRALAGVIDLLAAEVDLILLTDARRDAVDTVLPQHALRPPDRTPEVVWLQWNVARWLRGFDGVFHGTFNAIPFWPQVPAVVTIHDISFEVHPEDFSRAKRRVFQLQARRATRIARSIVSPSTFNKGELIRHYGVEKERVVVIPLSIDPLLSPEGTAETRELCERLGVSGRYIVALGGARRRGLDVAVAAWRQIRSAGIDVALVVFGPDLLPPEHGLVSAGPLEGEARAALLSGADAFCYPTRYESFGLPALESIASGTPVVCARVGALPEVLGDAAEWCEAPAVEAIADGLRHVLDDFEQADALQQRGLERAARHPTWERAASMLLEVYREAHST